MAFVRLIDILMWIDYSISGYDYYDAWCREFRFRAMTLRQFFSRLPSTRISDYCLFWKLECTQVRRTHRDGDWLVDKRYAFMRTSCEDFNTSTQCYIERMRQDQNRNISKTYAKPAMPISACDTTQCEYEQTTLHEPDARDLQPPPSQEESPHVLPPTPDPVRRPPLAILPTAA